MTLRVVIIIAACCLQVSCQKLSNEDEENTFDVSLLQQRLDISETTGNSDGQGTTAFNNDTIGEASGHGGEGSDTGNTTTRFNSSTDDRLQLRRLQARRNASSCTPVCSEISGGCMPQLYLLGAQKAGSSSMFSMLMQDSSSCGSNMPGYHHKETHMLTDTHSSGLTREKFTSVFRPENCNSRCFVEGTPNNIFTGAAPGILFGLMTAAERAASKFLLVVREPVSRDISYFNHFHANHSMEKLYNIALYEEYTQRRLLAWQQCAINGSASFVSSIDVYERCKHGNTLCDGMYWPQISNWEQRFGKEQILVVSSDAMFNEPSITLRQVYAHLGLESLSGFSAKFPHSNAQEFPGKVDSIDCATKQSLRDLYKEWNQKLHDAQPGLQAPWASAVTAAEGVDSSWDTVACTQMQAADAQLKQPAAVTRASSKMDGEDGF